MKFFSSEMDIYSHAVFNEIESLHDATQKFEEKGGADFIEKTLKPLILKYNLAKDFGIILVHRHFDMDATTFLVEKDLTTAPWSLFNELFTSGASILPSSWTLNDNQIWPYEFRFVRHPVQLAWVEQNQEFVREFFELIDKQGLAGYLGLRRTPIDPKSYGEALECTMGKVNVIFREGEVCITRIL